MSAKLVCSIGTVSADGQGNVEGQPLGIPGIWHGASSEQGISSEDEFVASEDAAIPGMFGTPNSCMDIACIPAIAGGANATAPTTIRWRANRLARSTAKVRERTMTKNLPDYLRRVKRVVETVCSHSAGTP